MRAIPHVIGHRGACGYRPEHTLASYELAARQGADFLEPDLVSTADGVLVARHENEIGATTDVADHPEFAPRRTTRTVDGVVRTGWFTEDFTLEELRTLRATERIPAVRPGNTVYNGRFVVPTLREILSLRERLVAELGREIGVYPETKHPSYFRARGLPLEEPLITSLRDAGLNDRKAPVVVQSFEVGNLERLRRMSDVTLVQLLGEPSARPADVGTDGPTYGELATADGLRAVAHHADGVGPAKEYVIPRDSAGHALAPTTFVADAHRAGLLVHPYTFRAENRFLPVDLRSSADPAAHGDLPAELAAFFAAGVDGVFTDHPDIAVDARAAV